MKRKMKSVTEKGNALTGVDQGWVMSVTEMFIAPTGVGQGRDGYKEEKESTAKQRI